MVLLHPFSSPCVLSDLLTVAADRWEPTVRIEADLGYRANFETLVRGLAFTPDGERLIAAYMFHGIWLVMRYAFQTRLRVLF